MDDTNLNNSGQSFGAAPNWTGTGLPGGVPGLPGTGTTPSTVPSNLPPIVDPDIDVLGQVEVPNISYNVGSSPTNAFFYNSPLGLPVLITPTINDPSQAARTLNYLQNPFPQSDLVNFITNSFSPNGLMSIFNFFPTQSTYTSSVTDPEIINMARQKGIAPEQLQQEISSDQNYRFSDLAGKYPEDVANKLLYAHYMPEHANLSPELQQIFNSINQQVQQGINGAYGFSDDWTGVPADNSDFELKFNVEYDNNFEALLNQKIADGSLSEADAQMLKAMHNGLATGTPTLQNLLKQLEGQVVAQLQAKYGFDVAFTPKSDTTYYNNVVNGDFAQTYKKAIDKYTGTATAEQKALLEQYAANPRDPTIPDSIKQLAKQIAEEKKLLLSAYPDTSSLPDNLKSVAQQLIQQTTNTIIEKYGLDTTWAPTLTSLSPVGGIEGAQLTAASNALSTIQEVVAKATEQVNAMPDGPDKTQFLAFLKVISQALIGLQETVYAMQASQSQTSKDMNRAKLDSQLNDIDKQQRAADEAREKQNKMASLGPLGKIFEWIFKIIILMVGLAAGPIGVAFALAYFADSVISKAMGNKETFTQKMFEAIAKALPPGAAAAINGMLAVFISMLSGNVFLAINLITQDSRCIQSFVKACGGDVMAQEITAMVFNMVAQIAIMVVLMIVTGGAASAALAGAVAKMVADATQIALKTAQLVVKIAMYTVQAILAAVQITAAAVSINNNVLLSQMDIIKGEAEAYSEKVQAIIQCLKKAIEKLLALLQGSTDTITNINNFQGKKWSDASQITSDIAG